jgi:hypothetical protein
MVLLSFFPWKGKGRKGGPHAGGNLVFYGSSAISLSAWSREMLTRALEDVQQEEG